MTTLVTITEQGICREAGYGGFGRFGSEALGRQVDVSADAPGGCRTHVIVGVERRIHTSSGGGPSYVFARAEAI